MIDTALQFSGGKDSLACLYLYKERWDEIYVVWLDTGASYPEMIDYMDRWAKRLPHFVHLKSDQPANIAERGWPVDIVPVENTALGKVITGNQGPTMQSCLECCAINIWIPLYQGIKDLGVTKIIKGQRMDDRRKSTSKNGQIIDGIEYIMPVEDWTEEQIFNYLRSVNADMPTGYGVGEKTGRDCWDCTGFLDDSMRRIHNLPEDKRSEMLRRLDLIGKAIDEQRVRYG